MGKGTKSLAKQPSHTAAGGETGESITVPRGSSSSLSPSSCKVDYLGLKSCVLAQIFPGSGADWYFSFYLFADGVCLVDPEYLKDRKGIDTETQQEGRGWNQLKAHQQPGTVLRLKLLRVTYSSLSIEATAAKDMSNPVHI